MVAEPGSAAVARRVTKECHGRAVAAAQEAKEMTEKLECPKDGGGLERILRGSRTFARKER